MHLYHFAAGQTDESVQLAGPVAGGVAVLVVVAAGVITLVFFLRRRYGQQDLTKISYLISCTNVNNTESFMCKSHSF